MWVKRVLFRAECEVVGVQRRKGGGDGAEARREDRARSRRGEEGGRVLQKWGKANGNAV